MALQNIEANITLDLYNHDTTPSIVKAIQLDSQTRYVAARLQNMGAQYDVDSGATVQPISRKIKIIRFGAGDDREYTY